MRIKTIYKKHTGSFYTGGRSFLLCSVLLLLAALGTFIWLCFHDGDRPTLKYMLYSLSVVLVMAGLTLYSVFAFRTPDKASKFLWIPLVAAVITFIAAILVDDAPAKVNHPDGIKEIALNISNPRF